MPFDKQTENEQETQSEDFDLDAAAAEISTELFGQGSEEEQSGEKSKTEGAEEETSSSTENETDASASPPQQTEEEQQTKEENSAEVQEIGAPKTWNKEELAKWATLPKEVQDTLAPILARREEDFLRGITQYKDAADLGVRYSKVVEPYTAMLAAENVDPVGLFQSFAANHYRLSRGTTEEKVAIAAGLLNGYNIPLADLLNHLADTGSDEPVDPKYAALEKRFNELNEKFTTRETSQTQEVQKRIADEVNAFAADPAHPHFNEVAQDIQRLFAAGAANTLQEAYDKACWANPDVREKMLASREEERKAALKAEEEKRLEKVRKSTADNVEVTGSPRSGTVPKGSMDDTLNETLASIEKRA